MNKSCDPLELFFIKIKTNLVFVLFYVGTQKGTQNPYWLCLSITFNMTFDKSLIKFKFPTQNLNFKCHLKQRRL